MCILSRLIFTSVYWPLQTRSNGPLIIHDQEKYNDKFEHVGDAALETYYKDWQETNVLLNS